MTILIPEKIPCFIARRFFACPYITSILYIMSMTFGTVQAASDNFGRFLTVEMPDGN
jgi:hypothetical protein